MNAGTAGHAGTPQLRQLNMVNIKMFRHPKYYKELRKRNKSDQVISSRVDVATSSAQRAPGPGQQQQVTSHKLPGPRPISNANKGLIHKQQATSSQASSGKHQAPSCKHQASSRKRQAPRFLIHEKVSRYKNTEEVFLGKGPRAFTMINVLRGCLI